MLAKTTRQGFAPQSGFAVCIARAMVGAAACAVVPGAAGQAVLPEPIRGLDQRFSEEIGIENPVIYEPDASLALQPPAPPPDDTPEGFSVELKLARQHVSNALRTSGRGSSDNRWVLDSLVGYETDIGRHRVKLSYTGKLVSYTSFSRENTNDHKVGGEVEFQFTKRFGARLEAGYQSGHDERGSIDSRLIQSTLPDLWRNTTAGLTLTYGRRIAKAQIEASARHRARRYTNNNQQVRDVDSYEFEVRGYYNVTPTFSAFLEASRELIDYRDPASNLGGERWAGFAGVRWEATARTTGEFKLGRQKRWFEDGSVGDSLGDAWDLRVTWSPREDSVVQAFTSQTTVDGSGDSATQMTTTYGATFSHAFSRTWQTSNQFLFTETQVGANREDQGILAETSLTYVIDDGLELTARYQRSVRTSTQLAAGFKDNIYSVQLVANYPELLGR